jgi:hypothetical protein
VTAFDDATAIRATGEDAYTATSDADWSAPNGPNGGYLAAIVLRAMAARLSVRCRSTWSSSGRAATSRR